MKGIRNENLIKRRKKKREETGEKRRIKNKVDNMKEKDMQARKYVWV